MTPNGSVKAQAIRRSLARLAVAGVICASQAFASPAAAQPSSDKMLSHMAARLNLSDAQTQQVKQIFDSRQAQMATTFQALRSARQSLQQATKTTPVNEGAIRNAAQALAQAEGDLALLHAQVHAQILPLLNADQQQKFASFGEGRRGHWKSHSSGATD